MDRISMWQLFLAGGPVMWPILLCSVFALAITVERLRYLGRIRAGTQGLLQNILDNVKRHQIKEAFSVPFDAILVQILPTHLEPVFHECADERNLFAMAGVFPRKAA